MSEKKAYDDRVVAFIDILGFEHILNATKIKTDQNQLIDDQDLIKDLYDVFMRIRDLMGVDEQVEGVAESRQVTQFSDSIVISFEISDEPLEFKYLLGELLHLTYELLKSEILIRGGISYGSLIHTDKVLFGTALVHAYMVESKAAVSPRIILPKSLFDKNNEYRKLLEYADKSGREISNFLNKDEDDFYYIDYFDKCQKPELGIFVSDNDYIDHLKRLKVLIINGLRTNKQGLYSKYGWMKTKWNRTILKYKTIDECNILLADRRNDLAEYFSSELLIETSM